MLILIRVQFPRKVSPIDLVSDAETYHSSSSQGAIEGQATRKYRSILGSQDLLT